MEDLIKRVKLSNKAVSDKNLPIWKRLNEGLSAYAKTNLTILPSDIRYELESSFSKINHILSKYEITKAEDYNEMNQDDLRSAIRIVKKFSNLVLTYDK